MLTGIALDLFGVEDSVLLLIHYAVRKLEILYLKNEFKIKTQNTSLQRKSKSAPR
jgi:hypothetical protein